MELPDDELSLKEVARMAGVSRQAVYLAVRRGLIPATISYIPQRKIRRADAEQYIPNLRYKLLGHQRLKNVSAPTPD